MKIIIEMINHLFNQLPYSKQNKESKDIIIEKLTKMYSQHIETIPENKVIGDIISNYGSLKQLEKLAPIDYLNQEIPHKKIKQQLLQMRLLYTLMSFFIASIFALCSGIYIYSSLAKIIAFGLAFGVILIVLQLLKKYHVLSYGKCQLSQNLAEEILTQIQVYKIRLINSIILFIAMIALQLYGFITLYTKMNMSVYQVAVTSSLWLVSIGVFFVLSNGLLYRRYQRLISSSMDKEYHQFLKKFILGSFIYGGFVALILFFTRWDAYPFANSLWLYGLGLLYVIIFYSYSFVKRRSYGVSGYKLAKWKKVAIVCGLVFFSITNILTRESWWIQPYISMIPSVPHRENLIEYDTENGEYTITMNNDDFKILQLTDVHLGGSTFSIVKDMEALQAVYTLIERTRPDLVIVTGDFVFPVGIMSLSLNNYTPMMQFASFMRNIGVPWAMTYGNHDTEEVATHDFSELEEMFTRFSFENTGNLLYNTHQPDITGRSNQLIRIKDTNGNLNQILYLLDSNSYVTGMLSDYDYIRDDQVNWYKETLTHIINNEGFVNSLLFTHIPLQEYQTAFDLYNQGSDEVTYHYGEIGEAKQAISASKYHSTLFDTMKQLGSTKGMFVGHDHYNNLSITYEDIRLTFGMSIDYLAMPGIANRSEQRGGTLITLDQEGHFEVEKVPLEN